MIHQLLSFFPIPKSQVVFFSGLLVSLIFALLDNLLIRRICKPSLRHLFNASAGLFLIFYTYGQVGFIALLAPALLIYLLRGIFYKNNYAVLTGWIVIFVYLAFNHLQRVSYTFRDYQVLHTASLMVLVARLTMFISDLGNGKIPKTASLIKFLAYCFYYPTVLGGPCMRIDEYSNCYDRELDFSLFKTDREAFERAKRTDGFKRIGQSLLAAVVYVGGSYFFKAALIFEPEFINSSLLKKILLVYFIAIVNRSKYYLAWGFAEGCCRLTGAAFSGYDSKHRTFKWETARLIKIMDVELATSPRDLIANWHIHTAKWLYDYVYLPAAAGKKPGFRATFFTNLTSAFWHGFRWGYYVTFSSVAFTVLTWRILRRKLYHPISRINPTLSRIVGIVLTQFFGCTILMPFILLGWKESLFYLKQVYYAPQIVLIVLFVIGISLPVFK